MPSETAKLVSTYSKAKWAVAVCVWYHNTGKRESPEDLVLVWLSGEASLNIISEPKGSNRSDVGLD